MGAAASLVLTRWALFPSEPQNGSSRSLSPEGGKATPASGTATPDLVDDVSESRATSPPESGTVTPACGKGIRVHVGLGGPAAAESGNVSPVWLGECGLAIGGVGCSASPAGGTKPRAWRDDAVIDIGGGNMQQTLHVELAKKFLWQHGMFQTERVMPSSVLHDEHGLKMWPLMTHLPNYYQTRDEIALLKKHGEDLAQRLEDGVALVDLGCG
jgi:hypothetical protein